MTNTNTTGVATINNNATIVVTTTGVSNNNETMTATSTTTRLTADTENSNIPNSKTIDLIIECFGIALIAILIILFIMRFSIHCIPRFSGGDSFEYGNIIGYIHSGFDFWSDLLFVYAIYWRKNAESLFYASLTFTILPMIISLAFTIYWIYRWRIITTTALHRLTDYLQKYSVPLIIMSLASDFYSCILLARSKLLYLDIFNLSLKEIDMDRLLLSKFISRTLLEVEYFVVIPLFFLF